MGNRPVICAAVAADNPAAVKAVAAEADLLEVRIDLIGNSAFCA